MKGAVLECELAGGIALYDVVPLLRSHPTKTYARRDPADIVRVYHHHSGAMGRDGLGGAQGAARYVVGAREWPGFPYHYFLPYRPDRDPEGRMVVYRGQPDEVRSYHTGAKANSHGVAVCWQGNLRLRHPSTEQYELAEALCAWLMERHDLADDRPFSYHSEAGAFGGKPKPACPGHHVEAWVRKWRGDSE